MNKIRLILIGIIIVLVGVIVFNSVEDSCHPNLPMVNPNSEILSFVKEGVFNTNGFIIIDKNNKIPTQGKLKIYRDQKNRLHYNLHYSGKNVDVYRKGFYTIDRFGVIHRIIEENTGNDKEIHQYSNAVVVSQNECITQGSGTSIADVKISKHSKCLETILKNINGKMVFYLVLNGKKIEHVEW
jgi:hypothetical protein